MDENTDKSRPAPLRQATPAADKTFSIRGRVVFGLAAMLLLIGGVGGWAATAELSGAVIASGSVVVDKNVKKVQHRDGGIVSQIHVKNGDRVEAGQVMVELDDTQIRAELGVVTAQLTELTARKARLAAESSAADDIAFPEGFAAQSTHAAQVVAGEERLFREARTNLKSRREQFALQIEQLEEEITGLEAQRESKSDQLSIMESELEQVEKLYDRKLTAVTRVYALQRETKRLKGERGGLVAQIARARGKISEVRLQILSVDQTARLEAQRELRVSEARIAELAERDIAARDKLKHTRLIAPRSGVVHELAVHTIGGILTPAETAMLIVPADEQLTVRARIAPVDIDQVAVGREATLRFSAFNQQTTPEIKGRVVQVSADVTTDPATGQTYYTGRIAVEEESKADLAELELLPGMPVEVFISTGGRTALSYLSKPVTDQFKRALREQ